MDKPAPGAAPIYARRMIRRYTDQPVPDEAVERILKAATRAPSPHNRQPWRFAVVTGSARGRLAEAMAARLRLDLAADGLTPAAIERDAARSSERINAAPVSVAVCLCMAEMDAYPDPKRSLAERTMAIQGVAAAAQNMLLAAGAEGLGACWMCAPLFCQDAVVAALELPADWEPQALITLGHPADAGRPRERKPLAEVARWVKR